MKTKIFAAIKRLLWLPGFIFIYYLYRAQPDEKVRKEKLAKGVFARYISRYTTRQKIGWDLFVIGLLIFFGSPGTTFSVIFKIPMMASGGIICYIGIILITKTKLKIKSEA